MPTLLLLDCSLSMMRLASPTSTSLSSNAPPESPAAAASEDSSPGLTLMDVAKRGMDRLLSHLETSYRMEHVSLLCYSSDITLYTPFQRDVADIRQRLNSSQVEGADTANAARMLRGAIPLVSEQWGAAIGASGDVKIVLVTDGGLGHGQFSLPSLLRGGVNADFDACFPFPFNGQISVLCLAQPGPERGATVAAAKEAYEKVIERSGLQGRFLSIPPDTPSQSTAVAADKLFAEVISEQYREYTGTLRLGNEMSSPITLCPPPTPYKKTKDFEVVEATVLPAIDVVGFLGIAEVASPPVLSRHLVLPAVKATEEENRNPNLCVFLHGGLKMDNMCALVQAAPNWFGILFSHSDNKKKSCLMLALFEPGPEPVPWLGNLTELGPIADLNQTEGVSPFPVKSGNGGKPSYSNSGGGGPSVVWMRQASLQLDVQKILRQARKLPEKQTLFYRELNRLKRAALCVGFHELLEGLASTFERECRTLPGNAHPDCALQLSHAADELRKESALDLELEIKPSRTRY